MEVNTPFRQPGRRLFSSHRELQRTPQRGSAKLVQEEHELNNIRSFRDRRLTMSKSSESDDPDTDNLMQLSWPIDSILRAPQTVEDKARTGDLLQVPTERCNGCLQSAVLPEPVEEITKDTSVPYLHFKRTLEQSTNFLAGPLSPLSKTVSAPASPVPIPGRSTRSDCSDRGLVTRASPQEAGARQRRWTVPSIHPSYNLSENAQTENGSCIDSQFQPKCNTKARSPRSPKGKSRLPSPKLMWKKFSSKFRTPTKVSCSIGYTLDVLCGTCSPKKNRMSKGSDKYDPCIPEYQVSVVGWNIRHGVIFY